MPIDDFRGRGGDTPDPVPRGARPVNRGLRVRIRLHLIEDLVSSNFFEPAESGAIFALHVGLSLRQPRLSLVVLTPRDDVVEKGPVLLDAEVQPLELGVTRPDVHHLPLNTLPRERVVGIQNETPCRSL